MLAIYWELPLVFGISQKQLSPELVVQCLSNTNANAALLPPSILEDMSQEEKWVELLARLKFVAFAGGRSNKSFRRPRY